MTLVTPLIGAAPPPGELDALGGNMCSRGGMAQGQARPQHFAR